MDLEAPDVASALDALNETSRLRKTVRATRRPHWFPLVLFGVLVLGAAPFYWQTVGSCSSPTCGRAIASAPLGGVAAPWPPSSPIERWATVYWVAALAVGLLGTALFYRSRAAQIGVDLRVWPVAVVGAIFAGLLIVSSPGVIGGHRVPGMLALPDLHLRGTTPILLLAVVLAGLAVVERSRALAVFAGLFIPMALLANLYNLENFVQRLGWWVGPAASNLPNVVLPALMLLIGGGLVSLCDRCTFRVSIAATRRG